MRNRFFMILLFGILAVGASLVAGCGDGSGSSHSSHAGHSGH